MTGIWPQLLFIIYVLVKCVEWTHSAKGLKLFVRDETPIQAKQEYRGVREHASEDDQVVHVGTGHLDESEGNTRIRVGPIHQKCYGMEESEPWKIILYLQTVKG